jgi:hypothetical protein
LIAPITQLGGGKSWMVGDVRVHLWPFVAFAIFVVLLVAYDRFLA